MKLNIGMNMIGMVMRSGATINRTDTLGRYAWRSPEPARAQRNQLRLNVKP